MAYTVSFDAGALIQGLKLQVEAGIKQAVANTANAAMKSWIEAVGTVPGVRAEIKDRYMSSIKCDFSTNGWSARIYSDDPMATPIETGIPARDLKRMLDTSLKTRVAKGGKHAGQRYMIIPMRHNTPGNDAHAQAMPSAVYAQAEKLKKSSVTQMSFRKNQLGVHGTGSRQLLQVPARTYNWGGRLGADVPKRFQGMVRFNTSSGGQKPSAYMTFRVMGEWSPGWIIKAQPGRFIVKGISEAAQQMLNAEVAAAIASVT